VDSIMPLVTCRECGTLISDKAAQCPHCGIRLRSGGCSRILWVLAGVVLGLVIVNALVSDDRSTPEQAAVAEQLTNAQKIELRQFVRRSSIRVGTRKRDGTGSSGSGVVVQRAGPFAVVITNAHVVGDESAGTQIGVFPPRGDRPLAAFLAKRIAGEYRDFAFLVVQDPGSLLGQPVAVNGTAQVGSFAVAVGNPLGEEFLIDEGHIRSITDTEAGRILLHDALIERGSSGGGLFNSKGELIGINTFMLDDGAGGALYSPEVLERTRAYHVRIGAVEDWKESGIQFDPDAHSAQILAFGTWSVDYWQSATASGAGYAGYSIDQSLPYGALIARVGNSPESFAVNNWWEQPTDEGERIAEISASRSGMIRLRSNDYDLSNNSGFLDVVVLIGPKER
jgi:S1-C subfamily serine protease